jgi:hypothetical protein
MTYPGQAGQAGGGGSGNFNALSSGIHVSNGSNSFKSNSKPSSRDNLEGSSGHGHQNQNHISGSSYSHSMSDYSQNMMHYGSEMEMLQMQMQMAAMSGVDPMTLAHMPVDMSYVQPYGLYDPVPTGNTYDPYGINATNARGTTWYPDDTSGNVMTGSYNPAATLGPSDNVNYYTNGPTMSYYPSHIQTSSGNAIAYSQNGLTYSNNSTPLKSSNHEA